MEDAVQMVELKNGEESRAYVYPDGSRYSVSGVTHVCVRPSGTHRLNKSDGTKVLVLPGWVAIEFVMDAWSL